MLIVGEEITYSFLLGYQNQVLLVFDLWIEDAQQDPPKKNALTY